MRPTVRRVLTVAAATLGAAAALRAQGGTSLLISPQELNAHLNDPSLVLLYVGPKESYDKGHIPGARFVDLRDVTVTDTARKIVFDLPDEADLRARLERFGIGDKSLVVVVPGDDWGSPSTRVVWTLQAAGLGARTRLLNGGSLGWTAAGFATTSTAPAAPGPAHLSLASDRSITVDYRWMQAHANVPHVRLIDARSPVFYEGPGMPEHNSPGGHIPGAKNLPFDGLFDNAVKFLSTADLEKKFADAGVAPGDTVAAYCHIGQQATAVLFAARLLGHPIRLYDGSMNDWQRRNLPLEGAAAAIDARAQAAPPQPAQHGANPTVSPDGRRIAFLSDRDGTEDLYVMNADGSDVRRLPTGVRPGGRPYWSADGRTLTFNVSANDTVRVMSISADGGAVTERAKFAGTKGVLTFDGGSRVVLGIGSWTETQLYTSRIDGSGRMALTADHAAYWCPAVTTHGDQIAVGRRDSSEMQIWLVNTDGSGAHALTRFAKSDGSPQCPSFSLDGRRVAVQSEIPDRQDPKRQIGNIWIVDVATGRAVRLAEHATPYVDELPAWFPDGKRIAFQSDRTGRWEIWVMNADGTDVRQLTR